MNAVERVRALFTEGAVIETVENTYIPKNNGMRRRITKLRKSGFDAVVLNGHLEGKAHVGHFPARVKDVLAVSDTEATFYLDQKRERLKGHTLTLRVVSGA